MLFRSVTAALKAERALEKRRASWIGWVIGIVSALVGVGLGVLLCKRASSEFPLRLNKIYARVVRFWPIPAGQASIADCQGAKLAKYHDRQLPTRSRHLIQRQ